jgi:phenylacetate-CoA ligase
MKATSMRNIWGCLLEYCILPLGDSLTGHPMVKRLHALQKAQWWDRERLYSHRDQLLRSVIETSYNEVPFYRQLFDNAGVSPKDILTARDLSKIPVVTKDMLRPAYPDLTTRNTGHKRYEQRTSGSTGKNFCVSMDSDTAGWYRAAFLLSLNWAGWNIGERHFQTGMTLQRGWKKRLKDSLLGCYYASAYELNDQRLDFYLDILDRKKIRHLWGYPGSILYLANRAAERGWNRPMTSIVTWGDTLTPIDRNTIESVFQKRIHDTYGCAEGMQIAAQCGSDSRYHIHALDVIVEILDDDNQPVPDGETGNIVVTRLHPGPMPLIHYKIGDLGKLGMGQPCACGRSYDMLDSIQGRTADAIITPSGNRLIVHFFTGILEHFNEIDSFQVVQEIAGSMTVKLLPSSTLGDQAISKIISVLKSKGAGDMNIEVEVVDEIPLNTTGKRHFIINTMKH